MTPAALAPSARSSRILGAGTLIVGVLAVLALVWPLARLPIHYPIEGNETWNALLAGRAMGEGELYPSIHGTVLNNYPPLSFYVVGLAGRLVGDNIVAGRLISLLSVLVIGANIAWIVRNLGGQRTPAVFAGVLFVAIMAKSFPDYVAMNDPQLLAQAVMSFGFAIFSARPGRVGTVAAAAAIMVAAGFFKHNILAMPLAATLWLAHFDRPMLWRWFIFSIALLAAGFAICGAYFGPDFFLNLAIPRRYDAMTVLTTLGRVQDFAIPLILWIAVVVQLKSDRRMAMVTYLIVAGAVAFVLTKPGVGVAWNAFFDWVIGACVGAGVGLSLLGETRSAQRFGIARTQAVIVLALALRQILLPPSELLHLPTAVADMRMKEAALAPDLDFMRGHAGPALCEELAVCYWSGHQSLLNGFDVYEVTLLGWPNYENLKARISRGEIALLQMSRGSDLVAPAEAAGFYRRYDTADSVFFYLR
jgi:hypothetical protein